MSKLYHHPLCPQSRFIRLVLAEYGVEPELVEEKWYERRHVFLELDPAGRTPLLVTDLNLVISGAGNIAEYMDETHGLLVEERRLMGQTIQTRVNVRRLLDWFNLKFFTEVSDYLVTEKIYKRSMAVEQGGGPPDSATVRAALHNIRYHIQYMGYLLTRRDWLAADQMTLADLAAAAHLSCVDFLGDVPWHEDESVKHWYARIKSRPSFRSLLSDRIAGVQPGPTYANLDF